VLLALIDIIESLVEHVGGPQNLHFLMPTVEALCKVEDSIIADKVALAGRLIR